LIADLVDALEPESPPRVLALFDLFGISEYLYIALLAYLGVNGGGALSADAVLIKPDAPLVPTDESMIAEEPDVLHLGNRNFRNRWHIIRIGETFEWIEKLRQFAE
jgi:hypothetical protein